MGKNITYYHCPDCKKDYVITDVMWLPKEVAGRTNDSTTKENPKIKICRKCFCKARNKRLGIEE